MEIIKLTKENFENEVLNFDGKILVDFFATWCGPCQMLSSTLEEFASEAEGNFKLGKLDTDMNEELTLKYNISSIPCLIVFEGGKEKTRSVGLVNKDEIMELLND